MQSEFLRGRGASRRTMFSRSALFRRLFHADGRGLLNSKKELPVPDQRGGLP